MNITRGFYIVKEGDDLENISRQVYGLESETALLESANPQLLKGVPLSEGMILAVPESFNAPRVPRASQLPQTSTVEGEVSIEIADEAGAFQEFRFWESLGVERSLDRQSTFEFTAPFEPTNEDFQRIFRPLQFQRSRVIIGGEQVFEGIVMVVQARLRADVRSVSVRGYTHAAVLEDCTLPYNPENSYQFEDQNLRQIAFTVCRPFGLTPAFDVTDVGAPFALVSLKAQDKPMSFLRRLTAQRGFVIGSTGRGQPRFWQTTEAAPSEFLVEGEPPLTEVIPRLEPQKYFSHITALSPTDWVSGLFADPGSDIHTVDNPFLLNAIRPHVFVANDAASGDALAAAESKMGRMFADAVGYDAEVAGERDSQGRLWAPNTPVSLHAPSAFVRQPTPMIIRSVNLQRSVDGGARSTLSLILPGSFSGEIPERLPWD